MICRCVKVKRNKGCKYLLLVGPICILGLYTQRINKRVCSFIIAIRIICIPYALILLKTHVHVLAKRRRRVWNLFLLLCFVVGIYLFIYFLSNLFRRYYLIFSLSNKNKPKTHHTQDVPLRIYPLRYLLRWWRHSTSVYFIRLTGTRTTKMTYFNWI